MVETEIPCARRRRPSAANSSGREGPMLACPSDSSTTRLSRRRSLFLATSAAPANTPPWMAVEPRAPTWRIRSAKWAGSATGCAGTSTSIRLSKMTTEAMSVGSSRLIAMTGGLAGLRDRHALHGARAVDDERHVDGSARLRRLPLAALQGDLEVVLVRLAVFHDGMGEPRLEGDRLAGLHRHDPCSAKRARKRADGSV